MPGRYAEELRRMTRAQGGGTDGSSPPEGAPESGRGRRRPGAWIVVVAVLLVAGAGWWLVRQMIADSMLQDCVMSGRKNCAPLEVDSSGR